jgi:hypothetical protein
VQKNVKKFYFLLLGQKALFLKVFLITCFFNARFLPRFCGLVVVLWFCWWFLLVGWCWWFLCYSFLSNRTGARDNKIFDIAIQKTNYF